MNTICSFHLSTEPHHRSSRSLALSAETSSSTTQMAAEQVLVQTDIQGWYQITTALVVSLQRPIVFETFNKYKHAHIVFLLFLIFSCYEMV